MATLILDEADVRRIARDELQRPIYVTQRTVEAITSLPRRDYLRLSRAGAWPSTTERRLVIARTSDVIDYVERRLACRGGSAANDADAETIALGLVGARRVS